MGNPHLERAGSATTVRTKTDMLDNETLATQNSKWYIIRATPQADFLAANELLDAGFEIFSPRIKSHQPKNVPQFSPLFPGYLFLKWDMEGAGKPSLHGAPHVSGWVNFEGVAPAVPNEVISALAHRVEHINSDGGLWRRFEIGDKVRGTQFRPESGKHFNAIHGPIGFSTGALEQPGAAGTAANGAR